jgi:uncharacterized membrane protein (Fun14 family)
MFMDTVVMGVMGYVSLTQSLDLLMVQNLPITVIILLLGIAMSYVIQIILSRWIVLHYRQLGNVVKVIQEVEKLYGEKFISRHPSSVTSRFVIGFILVITSVG